MFKEKLNLNSTQYTLYNISNIKYVEKYSYIYISISSILYPISDFHLNIYTLYIQGVQDLPVVSEYYCTFYDFSSFFGEFPKVFCPIGVGVLTFYGSK